MFAQFVEEKTRGLFGYFKLAVRATFTPVGVAREIRLGEREDFNARLGFYLTMAATIVALHSMVAAALDVPVMPKGLDFVWQYVQPLIGGLMFLAMYLPIRLFGWTGIKFAEYFQAAAMSAGPSLFLQPFSLLPGILTFIERGKPDLSDPEVRQLVESAGAETLQTMCVPDFNSLICLNMYGAIAPETTWAGMLNFFVSVALFVPIVIIIKHATMIAYWKQLIGFAIIIFAIMAASVAAVLYA